MHPTTAELFAETIEKTGSWLEELARNWVAGGELKHVRDQLSLELRTLWHLPP